MYKDSKVEGLRPCTKAPVEDLHAGPNLKQAFQDPNNMADAQQ